MGVSLTLSCSLFDSLLHALEEVLVFFPTVSGCVPSSLRNEPRRRHALFERAKAARDKQSA